MAAKFFLLACATALFVNTIAAYPCGCGSAGIAGVSLPSAALLGGNLAGIGGCGCGYGAGSLGASGLVSLPAAAVSSGSALGVNSASSYAPSGIQLLSSNDIQGLLEASGAAPFIAAVEFDGSVPSSGSAAGSYSCGNGNVGISSDSLAAAGISTGNAYGIGAGNAYGIGAGNAYGIGAGNAYGIGAGNAYGLGAANLGALNLGSSIVGAEIAGLNAGLNAGLAGARLGLNSCGCY